MNQKIRIPRKSLLYLRRVASRGSVYIFVCVKTSRLQQSVFAHVPPVRISQLDVKGNQSENLHVRTSEAVIVAMFGSRCCSKVNVYQTIAEVLPKLCKSRLVNPKCTTHLLRVHLWLLINALCNRLPVAICIMSSHHASRVVLLLRNKRDESCCFR